MARKDVASMFAVALFIGAFASVPTSVQSIGVCYGVIGNNLPSRSDVVQLYRSKGINGMRIYFADGQALSALRNSGIGLILDIGNDQLANIASSTSNAASWVQNNVRPYYPAVNIKYIAAGNEVQGGATQSIVPAMRNLNAALSAAGLGAIKVSTSIRTGAPLLANVYPYFAYRDNPRNISLNYATFQPGTSVRDQNNGLTYTSLFDAMVDAVYAALEKAGAPGVKVVISEGGWPSAGGFAASADNARTYNQGLINHVGGGTPKKREALETYIFAMFNENQKTGDPTERSFGLFNPDKSPAYNIQF
uniref:Glucan endo-1,3-beta-glucosidase GII n=1 Tax=Aegilops tauschii TaxID=37682 RepID=M8C1U6_AEGTA